MHRPPRVALGATSTRTLLLRGALAALVSVVLTVSLLGVPSADAGTTSQSAPGQAPAAVPAPAALKGWEPFTPGQPYWSDFPDPSVLRIGSRYYAHGTNTHGVTLPTLISSNLRTWRAQAATAGNPTGDGLLRTASWSAAANLPGGRRNAEVWAPTVTRLGPARYVLAYATRVQSPTRHRMCISVATSTRPQGPFVDRTRRPVVCPRRGAIDPQIYVPRRGRPWLIWKVDHRPALLLTRAMSRSGTKLLRVSRTRVLARVAQRWEGGVIENPGMIRFGRRYYLFYSGNHYATKRYAISYLICRTRHGGCVRPRKHPLIASRGALAGPGGAAPFVDRRGRLRLAYHAWKRGQVGYATSITCRRRAAGCAQRRLFVATVRPDRAGRLVVVRRR